MDLCNYDSRLSVFAARRRRTSPSSSSLAWKNRVHLAVALALALALCTRTNAQDAAAVRHRERPQPPLTTSADKSLNIEQFEGPGRGQWLLSITQSGACKRN